MTLCELQEKIMAIKKERDICILAHSYQSHDITEVADFVGDSYGLSVKAASVSQKTVIMCGVRFMAETVKILSPEKTVILSAPDAGCPMADQIDAEKMRDLKAKNPGYAAVCYVNTTAELKTECDVCVTSSSAVKIIKNMPEKDILFVPDINLGSFVKKQCPEKNFKFMQGGCPRHAAVTKEEALQAKKAHPNALLLVHPECKSEVSDLADYVGSTTGIIDFAKKSNEKEFIIGTENSILKHLEYECPDKSFYVLSKALVCPNMMLTTLPGLYKCCTGEGGEEIILDEDIRLGAKRCIDRMIELEGNVR